MKRNTKAQRRTLPGTEPLPCYGKKAAQWGRMMRRRLYGKVGI